jgi:hypothetical protein
LMGRWAWIRVENRFLRMGGGGLRSLIIGCRSASNPIKVALLYKVQHILP